MNKSDITIIKEKRTDMSLGKRIGIHILTLGTKGVLNMNGLPIRDVLHFHIGFPLYMSTIVRIPLHKHTAVHDLRLQCLEFFNRFFEEGGKPYQPLTTDTKHVEIIKEEQSYGSIL